MFEGFFVRFEFLFFFPSFELEGENEKRDYFGPFCSFFFFLGFLFFVLEDERCHTRESFSHGAVGQ